MKWSDIYARYPMLTLIDMGDGHANVVFQQKRTGAEDPEEFLFTDWVILPVDPAFKAAFSRTDMLLYQGRVEWIQTVYGFSNPLLDDELIHRLVQRFGPYSPKGTRIRRSKDIDGNIFESRNRLLWGHGCSLNDFEIYLSGEGVTVSWHTFNIRGMTEFEINSVIHDSVIGYGETDDPERLADRKKCREMLAHSTDRFETYHSPVAPSLKAVLATADRERGARLFEKKCTSCHMSGAGMKHRIGPYLYGLADRQIASVQGFRFSSSLREKSEEKWSQESLNQFLFRPRNFAKNTKDSFRGLKNDQDRADMILYLMNLKEMPPPE